MVRKHKQVIYLIYDHGHYYINACQTQTNTMTRVSHVNFTYVSNVIVLSNQFKLTDKSLEAGLLRI